MSSRADVYIASLSLLHSFLYPLFVCADSLPGFFFNACGMLDKNGSVSPLSSVLSSLCLGFKIYDSPILSIFFSLDFSLPGFIGRIFITSWRKAEKSMRGAIGEVCVELNRNPYFSESYHIHMCHYDWRKLSKYRIWHEKCFAQNGS